MSRLTDAAADLRLEKRSVYESRDGSWSTSWTIGLPDLDGGLIHEATYVLGAATGLLVKQGVKPEDIHFYVDLEDDYEGYRKSYNVRGSRTSTADEIDGAKKNTAMQRERERQRLRQQLADLENRS